MADPLPTADRSGDRYARELERHLDWLDTFTSTALGVLAAAVIGGSRYASRPSRSRSFDPSI